MKWYSTLYLWGVTIRRQDIGKFDSLEEAIQAYLPVSMPPASKTLAVCETDRAEVVGLSLGGAMGLTYYAPFDAPLH